MTRRLSRPASALLAILLAALLATLLATLLSGCGGGREAFTETDALALRPADAELAAIYERSCRSCHTQAATGAPLAGDTAAWSAPLDKGMDNLLDNVINGYGGMPPLGLCMDCEAAEFEALIRFMAAAPAD